MEYETVKIAKVTGKCPACEDYAEKNVTTPPKIAVMSCEGACARGEVARRAANMVAHRLARNETVRICLGGAFTKDTGQRNLVRRAEKVIAIEGCFLACSSRMMKGVLPDLEPVVIQADTLYDSSAVPFGLDEVSDEMFSRYADTAALQIVKEQVGEIIPSPEMKTCCQASGCATEGFRGCRQ